MAIDTYKVHVYTCDLPKCSKSFAVEDRGGKTGQQPIGIFTGSSIFYTDKGFHRANWVACTQEHITGAVEHMVKESLGNK